MNASEVIQLQNAKGYKELKSLYPKRVEELEKTVYQHYSTFENWTSGKAKEIFVADGLLAVRYKNGNWWHYSKGSWY